VTAWVRVLYRTLTRGGHFLGYPLCWPRWFYSRRLFACPPRQGESQPCRRLQHTWRSDSLAADGHPECDSATAATRPACRACASAPCWAAETPAHERLPWPMPHALGVRARASLMEGTLAAFGGSKLVKQPSGQRAGGAMIGAQRVLAARRRPLTAGSVAANTAPQRIVRHRSPSFAMLRAPSGVGCGAWWHGCARRRVCCDWDRAPHGSPSMRNNRRSARPRHPWTRATLSLCAMIPAPNPGWRARVACMRHHAGGI
jgi:hypothetical protein